LSLGVAAFPEAGETASQLIDRADKAMYEAKRSGRNAAYCWEASIEAALDRMTGG
jgi:diguanylate cyclase (GGDEF)-like protein